MEHESEKNQDEQNWSRRVQPERKIEAVAESGSMDIDALETKERQHVESGTNTMPKPKRSG